MSDQPIEDEVPEADALEQGREVGPAAGGSAWPTDLPRDDASEADVVEQSQEVPLDEDDHDR